MLHVSVCTTICRQRYKYNVKCTLVQALRLCTDRTAHRESRGIALPFHDHGTRRVWGVSVTPRPLFTPGKTRYPLYRRLGGPQGRAKVYINLKRVKCIKNIVEYARSPIFYIYRTCGILDILFCVSFLLLKTMLHCFLLKMFVRILWAKCVTFGLLDIKFPGVFVLVCTHSRLSDTL
jgi:hypothetical protein